MSLFVTAVVMSCDQPPAVFSATIDEGQVIVTFLVLVGINLSFALVAGILIAFEVSFRHSLMLVIQQLLNN